MKKSIFLTIMFCALLFMTGCENPLGGGGAAAEKNYSAYEIHFYDEDFNHTEEIEARYDESGKLKKLEMYMVYPDGGRDCGIMERRYGDSKDLDYPGVEMQCTTNDSESKIYFSMTDESIDAGYLDLEDSDFDLIEQYEYFNTESNAKARIQEFIDYYKEEGIPSSDKNYAIIDGVRTEW